MIPSMKTCSRCSQDLPLTEFYRHPKILKGTINRCKSCTCRAVQANYRKNKAYYYAYEQERFHKPARKIWRMANQKRIRNADPEKYRARNAVSNALRDGRLHKLPCKNCGSTKSQAHHTDYTKPLEVEWLCFPCHRKQHGQTVN